MKYAIVTIVPLLTGIILIPIIIHLSRKFRILDHPGERKVHTISKPVLGGIGIALGFGLGFFFLYRFGMISMFLKYRIFLIGLGIMFTVGLLDDIFNLKPYVKLFAQVGAAILFVSLGEISTLFLPLRVVAYIITFLWIVGITNSFNLLDNMDGLTSGISIICAGIFALLYLYLKQPALMWICIVFMSAQVSFLIFNFNPSKIFMGDTGALFSGYFFATISIMGSYTELSRLQHLPVLIPAVVLTVPIFDTLSVMWIRLKNKKPLFKGDKNHFSHRLVELGMTHREAVLFIYLVTLGTGIGATFLISINWLQAILLFIQVLIFLVIIIILMITAKQIKQKNGESNNENELENS